MDISLKKALDLINSDEYAGHISKAYRKYENILNGKKPEEPIIHIRYGLDRNWLTARQSNENYFSFYAKRLWRYYQMGHSTVPAIHFDYGTGTIPSAFGVKLETENETSYLAQKGAVLHTDESADNLIMPDPLTSGYFPQIFSRLDYLAEQFPKHVPIACWDLQGPLNIAFSLRGEKIFMDMFDAPDRVNNLLSVITDFIIAGVNLFKSRYGDRMIFTSDSKPVLPLICNCSAVMISVEQYKQFIESHDQRLVKALGGSVLYHTCGNDRLFAYINKKPSAKMAEVSMMPTVGMDLNHCLDVVKEEWRKGHRIWTIISNELAEGQEFEMFQEMFNYCPCGAFEGCGLYWTEDDVPKIRQIRDKVFDYISSQLESMEWGVF